jgi:hypothetical protein
MATVEERLTILETKINRIEKFIKRFIKIKNMVVRKSESGRIQLRDVEE